MKPKCSCGKKANRHCPALNSQICSLCCGMKRHGSISCPDDCSYNPLNPALYSSHYIALEGKVQAKLIELLKKWVSKSRFEEQSNKYVGSMNDPTISEDEYFRRGESLMVRLYNIEEDEQGQTFQEYLERNDYKGFSAVERIVAEGYVNSSGRIVEIIEVSDDGRILAEDLFSDEELLIYDRSVAEKITRYDRVMLIYFQLPTYARITGITCVGIPRNVDEIFLAQVFASYQEAVRGNLNLTLGRYILENYLELEDELHSLAEQWQERMLSNLDFKECKAEFKLLVPREELLAILLEKEDFCFEEEIEGGAHYAWVRQGRSKKYEELHPTAIQSKDGADSVGLLGKLILQEEKLILINFGTAQYDFCREMLDQYFGDKIEFAEEIIVDQNEMLKTGERFSVTDDLLSSQKNSEEIPQEIKVQIIENFYRQHYEKFLTDPVPALSNKTPLQAAKDKKMKPALIELMKGHLNNIERYNKQEGANVKLDWVLERLGLKGQI